MKFFALKKLLFISFFFARAASVVFAAKQLPKESIEKSKEQGSGERQKKNERHPLSPPHFFLY